MGKAIYGLLTAGFVHRVGRTKVNADPRVSETRIEEHRNLGIAFYKTGMLDEAMRELRRVLELRATDTSARFFIGVALARQGKWAEATTTLKEAHSQRNRSDKILSRRDFVVDILVGETFPTKGGAVDAESE